MNTFKKILHTAFICSMCCLFFNISARKTTYSLTKPQRQKTPAAPPAPPARGELYRKQAVALPKKRYDQLLDDIKRMPSEHVVDPQGNLTDDFLKLIQNSAHQSGLDNIFIRALLQAGFNLHSSFADDNENIRAQLLKNEQFIENLIAPQPQVHTYAAPVPIAPITTKEKQIAPADSQPKKPQQDAPLYSKKQNPESDVVAEKKVLQAPDLITSGISALRKFREQTAQKIKTNPEYFYANGQIQSSWLQEAFQVLTNNGLLSITGQDRNKARYEVELAVAYVLSQLFGNDPDKDTIIQAGRLQVEQFMNAQGMGSTQIAPGIAALQNFRKETAAQPLSNFYNNGKIRQNWLKEALKLILHGAPLHTANKEQIQGELIGNATELAYELFKKENTLSIAQQQAIIKDIRIQTIAFVNQQPILTLPSAKNQSPEPIATTSKQMSLDVVSKQQKEPDKPVEHALPIWIDPTNKSLLTHKFEAELIRYVSKNQYASKKEIINHFAQQIKNHSIPSNSIQKAIRIIVQEIFKNPEGSGINDQPWPNWISVETDSIMTTTLIHEIATFLLKNTDADETIIFLNFKKQLPKDISHKKIIEAQLKATITTMLSP